MALWTQWQHWFLLACAFLFLYLNEEGFRYSQVPLWAEFPASILLLWTCGEWNLLILVLQQVVVARPKHLILKKLSASTIWFCLSNCATSSKRHPKWPSTCLSFSTFPLYCGGLRLCKADWHCCVGFRYVVSERQEAGKMRNNETGWRSGAMIKEN